MIGMNDFRLQPHGQHAREVAAVSRVLEEGWWILGKEVAAFESTWANYLGCAHAIGVGNGMDALEIGLRILGIGQGDEVITTPMTAFATVLAIFRAGATPVLADIEPNTAMITADSISRCITKKTKAVILVHLYGQVGNVFEIENLCQSQQLFFIEDCAQAHGAKFQNKHVGTFGKVAAWSFYPTKNLGAAGDAGAVTTASELLAIEARKLRNYGQSERYHHPSLGMNSRLDEIQAAILQTRIPLLEKQTNTRRQIAHTYSSRIENPKIKLLPLPSDPESHVHHLYVITTNERDLLQEHLRIQGVSSLSHYPIPIHHQQACLDIKQDPKGLQNAETHAATCLSIPCHPMMSDDEISRVINAVNTF